jgi:transcriptional regulator of acetoin/glycerol metabolism
MKIIMRHRWPGNIRELEHAIEHAFVLVKGDSIRPEHLPPELTLASQTDSLPAHLAPINRSEREIILRSLDENNYDRSRTAKQLGISRSTLWRKMKRYRICKS